ncbi:MAG TPA: hypothetical protein VGO98_02770, partial [Candidatus Saccharimonadales bacterium]|nr:hypothetical protein [Candidatus Saccharimonadales bacterium]
MPLKIHPPSHNHDSNGSYEKGPVPTLSESLRSFEGTAAESLIVKALQAEGIDPKTYNLDDYRMIHNNYRGLPSTEPAHGQADELSPIVRAIYEGIENGTIVDEQISFLEKDVRVKKDSPNQFLNRLFLIDT